MTHQCYLCNPDDPDRIVEGRAVTFGERFVGPGGRAHGGIAAASLTCPALQQAAGTAMENPVVDYVSGRLNLPVPLSTPLEAKVEPGDAFAVELFDGETPVVSGSVSIVDAPGSPGSLIKEMPDELASDVASMSLMVDANLEGPTLLRQSADFHASAGVDFESDCYGCSEKPLALKLHMRAGENGDLWTRFETDPECIDEPGRLATATVAAALDCSNLWVLMAREPDLGLTMQIRDSKGWMTGTHSVHFLRVPPASHDYRIVTRVLRQEGRKGFTVAALFDLEGQVYAVAEAVSILIEFPQATD